MSKKQFEKERGKAFAFAFFALLLQDLLDGFGAIHFDSPFALDNVALH